MKSSIQTFSTLVLAICLSLAFLLPTSGALGAMKADLNAATLEQLEAVKGIGHDTAQKILDYKKEHGEFTAVEELGAVSGVGKVRLEALNAAFMVEKGKKGEKNTSMK